jgi:hypothetical protein
LVTKCSIMTNCINCTVCVVMELNWLRCGNYNVLLNKNYSYCLCHFEVSHRCHFYRVWQVTGYRERFVIFLCQCRRTPESTSTKDMTVGGMLYLLTIHKYLGIS